MSNQAPSIAPSHAFVPLRLAGRPLALKALVLVLGVAFLTASSWVQVPMYPVPMTMQTFAVLMVGAVCGWRLGLATVIAWLALALELPVLSEGKFGPAAFIGTTGGYIVAFPIMAIAMGYAAERGWTARPVTAFLTLFAADAFCFALGVAWLSTFVGLEKAIAYGFSPFALGDLVKIVLATAVLEGSRRALPKTR
jgi:biotin transport system substrate-specific component